MVLDQLGEVRSFVVAGVEQRAHATTPPAQRMQRQPLHEQTVCKEVLHKWRGATAAYFMCVQPCRSHPAEELHDQMLGTS